MGWKPLDVRPALHELISQAPALPEPGPFAQRLVVSEAMPKNAIILGDELVMFHTQENEDGTTSLRRSVLNLSAEVLMPPRPDLMAGLTEWGGLHVERTWLRPRLPEKDAQEEGAADGSVPGE